MTGVQTCALPILVCDAINTAMRELFLQIVYGRTQSAFSEGGLAVGASLEDLGKGLRSQVGTMFATHSKGPRYLEMAEGYCTRMALNKDDEVIGYEFVNHIVDKEEDFKKIKWDDETGVAALDEVLENIDSSNKFSLGKTIDKAAHNLRSEERRVGKECGS